MTPSPTPANTRRVFVSYSSEDAFVRQLLARLQAQPLEVWDFRGIEDRIPGGGNILEECKRRVQDADVLLLVATPASLASRYVAAEVRAAIEATRHIMVWRTSDSPGDLERIHPELAGRLFHQIVPEQLESIEAAVAGLCSDLKLEHVGPVSERWDLPFMSKLYDELRHTTGARAEYESYTYASLMRLAERVLGTFERAEFRLAARLSRYLLIVCQEEFPGRPLYYAELLSAMCDLALGRRLVAERRLRVLETRFEEARTSPPDANLDAAFGHVHFNKREFDAAHRRFQRVAERNSDQLVDQCNPIVAEVRALAQQQAKVSMRDGVGETPYSLRALLPQWLDRLVGLERAFPEERQYVSFVRAIVQHQCGLSLDAEAALRRLVYNPSHGERIGQRFPSLYAELAELLTAQGRVSEAIEIVEVGTSIHPQDASLRLALGQLYLRARNPLSARQAFAAVIPDDRSLEYLFEMLFAWVLAGLPADASVVAHEILQGPLPESADDFYATGAAQAVLGNVERASYDFERSGADHSNWMALARKTAS